MDSEYLDIVIVGAGLSGIGMAAHLKSACLGKSLAVLEARSATGGTWDLFRYPGLRSDSDMYTLGYAFKPWRDAKAIADGPSILAYIRETARENDVERLIRLGHRLTQASWRSADASWLLLVHTEAGERVIRCGFLVMCSGYYDYAAGYRPPFVDEGRFAGQIIHPQFWPEDLVYAGKKVVVIGSGATAVTLVPSLADGGAAVTMLQRSPTYVVAVPEQDRLANALRRWLPAKAAYFITRWKNVLYNMYTFVLSKKRPKLVKSAILDGVRKQLGPGFDVDKHFTPTYNPWDQRICAVPDGDLFRVIKEGKATVVTDQIERFAPEGIVLKSGQRLEADIIVTATGLKLQFLGGVEIRIDNKLMIPSEHVTYKAMMYNNVPNLAVAFGYTNASWTLKIDLTAEYVGRLINFMEEKGYRSATPVLPDERIVREEFLGLESGYIQRAVDQFPKQGSKAPWRLYDNYALDIVALRYGSVADSAMRFARAPKSLDRGT